MVSAMIAIRDLGLPQPGCGWCISPWVDLEAIGETMSTKAAADPTVQKASILDMARMYLNGADPRSPLAAPIYANLTGLAPLLIQVGAAETLLDDAVRLAKAAGTADVRVDLQIWPEMPRKFGLAIYSAQWCRIGGGRSCRGGGIGLSIRRCLAGYHSSGALGIASGSRRPFFEPAGDDCSRRDALFPSSESKGTRNLADGNGRLACLPSERRVAAELRRVREMPPYPT